MHEHLDENDEKSRTKIKNEDRERQKLGERLLTLNDDQLAGIDIPEELAEAVKEARNIRSKQAKSRQIQYIGVLMRAIDTTPVVKAFELIEAGVSFKKKKVSPSSEWLNRLIDGDEDVIEEFTMAYPLTDRQKIRQLIRNAKKTQSLPPGKNKSKALLLYLNELLN